MKYLIIITALLLCFSVSATTNSFYVIDRVKVEIQKENGCYYLVATEKDKQQLKCVDDDQQSDIVIQDFNFDGYQDIAIINSLGMVNNVFYVFLYEHVNSAFKELKFSDSKMPASACGDLYNLAVRLDDLSLVSSCRSGPVWYYDTYRYNAQGELWLYKTTEYQNQSSEIDTFPLYEHTFNQKGEKLDTVAIDFDGKKIIWSVISKKVFLYSSPEETSKTKAYLIHNDKVEILQQKDDWIKIRFVSRKGPLIRWIYLPEAIAKS
ncbi:XAC2610-related protein [Aeromonas sp. OTU364]|uniref:XAC2610-related protein n=1 Tax=Aeromonas sp. OTU364 TaxID=3043864 RepID=UPI00313E6683